MREVVHPARPGLSRSLSRLALRAFFAKRLLRRLVELELGDDVVLERVETDAGGEQNLDAETPGVRRGHVEALVHAEDDVRQVIEVTDIISVSTIGSTREGTRLGWPSGERSPRTTSNSGGVDRSCGVPSEVAVPQHVEQRVDVRL